MARFRNQHTVRAAATPPVAGHSDRACAAPDIDPEIFFPTHPGDLDRAREICDACPHRQPCLDWALATEQTFGVWGGTSADQRALILRGTA